MSVFYQISLKEFLATKLNDNPYNIVFNTNIFQNIDDDEFSETNKVDNTYTTLTTRRVPTMITGMTGEYIPIPNLNGTNNSVEIVFDLAIDDMTGIDEDGFLPVNYDNTLLAIDNFKKTILANYFPLGTSNLMMGGEDSTIVGVNGLPLDAKFIYLKFNPKNNSVENILQGSSLTNSKLYKSSSEVIFDIIAGTSISVPYVINTEMEITISYDLPTTTWSITNGTDTDSVVNSTLTNFNTLTLGYSTGIECVLNRLVIDSETYTEIDTTTTYNIDLDTWNDKDIVLNSGDSSHTFTINNSILYGSDGNAVFQVYPLAVLGDYEAKNGINYRSFSLQLEAMVGDDFIFGNNFEYYLNDIQVFPVDRNHTFALDTQGRQGINENLMTFVGSESALDWTQSFFYQPTKFLTSLVKKITTGDVSQNTVYTLKVQYPFWNKEYRVVIEGGGINTDINSITTFSLQFKLADDILT